MTNLSVTATGNGYNSLGSEYEVQASRWKQRQEAFGAIDFKSNLFMSGVDGDAVLQKIEDHIEGGRGDGIKGNTLSWDRYISDSNNLNNVVFQSASAGTYTNIRFDKGYYTQMSEQMFAYQTGAFGNLENKPYDVVVFGQDSAEFVDYKFSGYNDGQTYSTINFGAFSNTTWNRNVSYKVKEMNLGLVNGLDDADDPETAIANYTFSQIQATEAQWMTDSMRMTLAQYRKGSQAYNQMYLTLAQQALDQELGISTTWWYNA